LPARTRKGPSEIDAQTRTPEVLLAAGESGGQAWRCALIGIENGRVLLESGKWIEPSSKVRLTFDRIALRGTVRYCNPGRNLYRVSVVVAESESEQRTALRFPMDEPGTLIALGAQGTVATPCRLTDFSRAGLGLESPCAIALDTMICVETSSIMVAGNVRRCLPKDNGAYHLGIAVTDILSDRQTRRVSPWSVAGMRLRLAEVILGRPINSPRMRIN
jgi:hypothetical protein